MSKLLAPLLVLCLAGAARAEVPSQAPLTLTLREGPLLQPEMGFRDAASRRDRSAVGVIASDALYGVLIGLVIGAGVALIDNDFNNGLWGRDLATGAGVGLVIGGIVGAIDVVTASDRVMQVPGQERGRGFGRAGGLRLTF